MTNGKYIHIYKKMHSICHCFHTNRNIEHLLSNFIAQDASTSNQFLIIIHTFAFEWLFNRERSTPEYNQTNLNL